MALEKETVAIPLSSGVQPSMRARLLEPQKLLVAENCAYILEQGPQKRNGHTSKVVRSSANYSPITVPAPTAPPLRDTYSTQNPALSANWVYGWGYYNGATDVATTTGPFEVSAFPEVGQIFGAASRDNEVLAWDGHRVFSYAPGQASKFGETQFGSTATVARGPSCMPAMRAQTIAKITDAQAYPDCADNGVIRVACWLNSDAISAGYSVFDSANKACLVQNQTITYTTPKSIRVVSCGPWFHILVSDSGANSLVMNSFHQDAPTVLTSQSLGTVDAQFDVKKIDETFFLVVKNKTSVLTALILTADGNTSNTFTPALGGFAASVGGIACEIDRNDNIGIVWETSGAPVIINFASYNMAGAVVTARQQVATNAIGCRISVSPRFVPLAAGVGIWDVFVEDQVSTIQQIRSYAVQAGVSSTLLATRHRMALGSHAFRVGNRNFIWAATWLSGSLGLQNTWFLCDTALMPVGKAMYGQANPDFLIATNYLQSVNWHIDDNSQAFKDRVVFHGALSYNQRVPNSGSQFQPTGVFTEPSIIFYELDFLPQLRSGQAGRSTYFAGAQLWAYDGAEMVEAGFHMAPEGVTGVASAGGSLSAGVYRYRVDLCHKNCQNEEVRSWSLTTAAINASASDKITLSIPVMPMTRREDAYFLIFRTTATGTTYLLASSRNPTSASFLRLTQGAATLTYVDTLSDTTLAGREYHPANVLGNYLDPLPAPACEIVAAGKGRLWLAGGELSPGEVAPSRLFAPGETPTFSPGLNIQVDRNAEPITAIGFVGDLAAVFRRTSTYVIDFDGPDNSFNGSWGNPRLTVADTGAVGQESLALTTIGLWFQSPAGLRLLGPAGTMDRLAGQDVDPLTTAAKFSSAVVVPQYTQVRWYSRDVAQPSIVLDYSSNAWSMWTGLTNNGAVFWPVSNLAILLRGDGYLWAETVGVYNDGGSPYEMRVRSAWLRGQQLGDFQRVRRIALFGSATGPINLRIRYFYDERPFHEEEQVVVFPANDGSVSQYNTSSWGDGTWGNVGAWGDDGNTTQELGASLWFRDGVFRFRKRPHRQKCSVFSVEFSDQGADGPGFEPVVLALELSRKPGLDRSAPN